MRQWLALNNDGYSFDRVNKQAFSHGQRRTHLISYKVIIYTGSGSDAGTDANVSIIVYGHYGNTGSLLLKPEGSKAFAHDAIEEFIIECADLGKEKKNTLSS